MNYDLTDMLAIIDGDQKALGRLYERHGKMVFNITMRILHDERLAQEVTQDVFLSVWQKAHKYDPKRAGVSTWLGLMARSRAIDTLRRSPLKEVPTEQVEETADNDNDPEDLILADNDTEQLRLALSQLTLLQRQCLEMMYFRGLKQIEIAQELNVPIGTVKARIFHSLNALRAILEKEGNL